MLNAAQQKAVLSTEGRLLVLAGAGSGKTRVIVHRIAHLIRERGVPPKRILGLTFTNKAAAEMRERIRSLIGDSRAKEVTLSTFHSFCMQVLRKEIGRLGFTQGFSLYDERDLDRLIQQLAREMLGQQGDLPSLAPTRAALSEAGNKGIHQEGHTWHDKFTEELYGRLQSTLRAYNAVSFDNLINLTIRLFEEHPDVLDAYQERLHYLMIDEYQDTNPAQFRLAELLAAKYGNLCVVGDDDQSIYGWRGAEVSHILHFKADAVIKLEQNYRSTPLILDAANAVISRNKNRHEKKLWSAEKSGDLIEVFNAPTDAEEAAGVVARLLDLKENTGMKWRDMAILYRSNALSRQFELALIQASWQKEGKWVRGIPYEVFGGLEFSERSEIKDLFAYLRVIANEKDEEALLRIINVPRRGISDDFLDKLTQENRSLKIPLWQILKEVASGKRDLYPNNLKIGEFGKEDPQNFHSERATLAKRQGASENENYEVNPKQPKTKFSSCLGISSHPRGVSGIRSFTAILEAARRRFCEGSLAEAFLWLLEEIQYKKAIEEEVKSEKMRLFKWENVQECVNAIAQYEQTAEEPSIMDFIASSALGKPVFPSEIRESHEDKVQLMTLHSAKGLEFPACFIVGLEDHILPHEKSAATVGIEEERRLFYVGITRARKYLTLSMARSRMRMGKAHPTNPSRFLFEIPKHLLKATSHKP